MELDAIMPVKLTSGQRTIYSRHIGNITYLSAYLGTKPTEQEIGILLKLELEGDQRDYIFGRLLGRLATIQRENWKIQLDKLLRE